MIRVLRYSDVSIGKKICGYSRNGMKISGWRGVELMVCIRQALSPELAASAEGAMYEEEGIRAQDSPLDIGSAQPGICSAFCVSICTCVLVQQVNWGTGKENPYLVHTVRLQVHLEHLDFFFSKIQI